MLSANLALVTEVADVELSELTRIAAALQKQITRDFGPIWGVDASIAAFSRTEDIPVDYWAVRLCYDVPEGSGGHRDVDGRPAAFVEWTDNWSLAASHEVLEMLADPWGKRLVAGPSLKPDQGRVEYLVEVADPCQASDYAYTINGEIVSDFYTPNFFDPVKADGIRYSFSGKITEPRQVLAGGYLSWFDSIGRHWWQAQRYETPDTTFVDCGELSPDMSFRAQIDGRRKPLSTRLSRSNKKKFAAAQNTAYNAARHRSLLENKSRKRRGRQRTDNCFWN
jgi:hypothetical protein